MIFKLRLGDTETEIGIVARRPDLVCAVDGIQHRVAETAAPAGQPVCLTVDGRDYAVWRVVDGDRVHVRIADQTFSVGYEDAVTAAAHEAAGVDTIHADMPGVAVDLHCEQGTAVAAGDPLLTIESMKMQITITAPRDGVVGALYVQANEPFQKGALLVSLEPETG